METEVATDVTFNGHWYTVTTPDGQTWTFDPEETEVAYIENALYAWSRWLDYVRSEQDASDS